MPSLRALGVAAVSVVAVVLLFAGWLHWPTLLAIGIGAGFGLVTLVIAAWVGDDTDDADAAWRLASADLFVPSAGAQRGEVADRIGSEASVDLAWSSDEPATGTPVTTSARATEGPDLPTGLTK